jgi:hypothetical protein
MRNHRIIAALVSFHLLDEVQKQMATESGISSAAGLRSQM